MMNEIEIGARCRLVPDDGLTYIVILIPEINIRSTYSIRQENGTHTVEGLLAGQLTLIEG